MTKNLTLKQILKRHKENPQGKELHKIRVKITDSANTVIYDTQAGAADTADPTTQLTSGSVRVH